MELYQLRTFLAIARTGNLTRAAAELHASQPTVSGQLKTLEDELRVTLFVRTPRGMELSEAGKQLREKAQEVADRATELSALAASLASDLPIRCRIGLNTTAIALRIPELVAILAESAPRLHLELHQDQSHGIMCAIASGELDAGFFFGSCNQIGIACAQLAEAELAIVGPAAWMCAPTTPNWTELLMRPWVMPPEACPFYQKTREFLYPFGKWPSKSVTTDDEATMLDLVRAEAGIALLPAFLVENEPGIAILRRTDKTLALAFAWQKASSQAAPIRPVLQALGQIWQETSLPG